MTFRLRRGRAAFNLTFLIRYAQIAERIGSPICRRVIDTKEHQPDFKEVIQSLKATLPEYEKRGVTPAIENHDRWLAKTLANLMHVMRETPIGICLDVANSLGREEPMRHVVEVLAPYAVNLHLKEYVIQRLPSYQGFVIHGAPFGQGMCDLDWLLPYMHRNCPRDVNAVLQQWAAEQATLEETIALEERSAARAWDTLRAKYFGE